MTDDDELVDVLDFEGRPTGTRRTKADVHREGLWHRSVHVWIVTPDGRVLLQKRARSKENHPGLWDVSAAGHVAAGETAVDAAIRETREELGLEIAADVLRHVGSPVEQWVLNEGRYVDNEFHDLYLVEIDIDPGNVTLEPAEVEAIALVPVDELAGRLARRDETMVPHWDEIAMVLETIPLSRWERGQG